MPDQFDIDQRSDGDDSQNPNRFERKLAFEGLQ
jgi:hypothetical protein